MRRFKRFKLSFPKRSIRPTPDKETLPGGKAHEQESSSLLQQIHVNQEQHQQPEEEEMQLELRELVPAQSGSSVDGVGILLSPNPNSEQRNQNKDAAQLLQMSVSQHFPAPPADLDLDLQEHLVGLQNTVLSELVRLCSERNEDFTGHVIQYYHNHIFDHLDTLLQNVRSPKNHFVLMNWVHKTYLSKELLGHPDLQKTDPFKNMDLLLLTDWEAKAKDKLLENVQKDVRNCLENILQNERTQDHCEKKEDYVRLYVDTCQCVESMHKAAQNISPKLSEYVDKVCFEELLTFVKRYRAEQSDFLRGKATVDPPETEHFLRTLKACRELKQHVQTKATSTSTSIQEELDNMEDFTLKLLMDIVTNTAETHLTTYFKSDSRHFSLCSAVEQHFPKRSYGLDEQKSVLDQAYKLIVDIYVKHLLKTNKSKLEKCWNPHVGQTISEDAQQLHNTISDLAPGVEKHNLMLLKITELVDCTCTEALKLTAASFQHNYLSASEDSELLPALLKWKGLRKDEVWDVLHAIDQDHCPSPSAASCCSCC